MRGQLIAAAGVLVVAAGWAVFQTRSSAPDPVRARDNLVQGEGLVASFTSTGFAEGYRFTSIRDTGWVWERTGDGQEPARIIHSEASNWYLLEVASGCYVGLQSVRPPLVPGITISESLSTQDTTTGAGVSTYDLVTEQLAPFAWSQRQDTVTVAEDLSSIGEDSFSATTTGTSYSLWYGDYEVRATDALEAQSAVALIEQAIPSLVTTITVRERVIGNPLGSTAHGPYDIVIPEDCPASAVELWPSSEGGQRPGIRASAPPFRIDADDLTALDVVNIETSIFASREELVSAAEGRALSNVALRSATTVVVRSGEAGLLAVEVVSCLTADGQPCS